MELRNPTLPTGRQAVSRQSKKYRFMASPMVQICQRYIGKLNDVRQGASDMSIRFNHTIVWCRDQQRSSTFLAEILGLAAPTRFGPFLVVKLDDGASLDF